PATATADSTANVGEGDFGTLIPTTISATEGISFTGAVGSFTDGYTGQVASDFTATIDWGDGTTDVGTVSGGNGLFTISGTHTYAEDGSYTVIASFSDDPPSTLTDISIFSTADVAESNDLVVTPATIDATEGQSFTGTVATFDDGDDSDPVKNFTATIDWGDGTTTTGAISQVDVGLPYVVTGTHTYADELTNQP